MDLGLDGRVAIVTGGNQGIGRAVCDALVEEGATVAILSRDPRAGEQAAEELGDAAVWFQADVADDAGVSAAVAAAADHFGGIDVVINNAGRFVGGPIEQIETARWLEGLETKTLGAIRVTRAALPYLKASDQARIVNVSGTSAVKVVAAAAITALTNAGLLTLTAYLAQELKRDGVAVTCVVPGHTLTEPWRERTANLATERGIEFDDALGEILHAEGFRDSRWGRPDEVAKVIVFLASRAASFVSGTAIRVDGAQIPTATLV